MKNMRINNDFLMNHNANARIFQKQVSETGDFDNVLQKALTQDDKIQLKDACREFESLFLSMMYKQMRATIPKSELLPASFARETFETMLDEELAKKASQGTGMGVGQMLYNQLMHQMQNAYTPASVQQATEKQEADEK